MKKLFSALLVGALAVSFTACKGNDPAAKSVKLEQTAVTLAVGETFQIKATTDPEGLAVTYTSQKAEVATVDANGLVTAVADGETIILVKSGDAKATLNVTVGKPGPSSKVPEPDAVEGKYLVIFRFNAEVCNDVVFIGSYNSWTAEADACVKFEPYLGGEKFGDETFSVEDGWMYVLIEDASESVEGKPVQLKNDGSFAWDYQCGDADAWTIHVGGVTINPGFAGECDLKAYTAVTVGEMKYWKNESSPCHVAEAQKVVITVKVPACGCPENVEIIGNFDGWAGTAMTKVEDGVFRAEIEGSAGATEYKFREAGTWDNEILVLGENEEGEATWGGLANIKLVEGAEVNHDFSGAEYKWSACAE